MISYELAKKLKEAGFPQDIQSMSVERPASWYNNNEDICDWFQEPGIYIPTPSELIEACGTSPLGFISLINESSHWTASGWNTNRKDWITEHGSTSGEAVANLYLALHSNG